MEGRTKKTKHNRIYLKKYQKFIGEVYILSVFGKNTKVYQTEQILVEHFISEISKQEGKIDKLIIYLEDEDLKFDGKEELIKAAKLLPFEAINIDLFEFFENYDSDYHYDVGEFLYIKKK
jgi:hypothetical protein